jgi:hypothetical protein
LEGSGIVEFALGVFLGALATFIVAKYSHRRNEVRSAVDRIRDLANEIEETGAEYWSAASTDPKLDRHKFKIDMLSSRIGSDLTELRETAWQFGDSFTDLVHLRDAITLGPYGVAHRAVDVERLPAISTKAAEFRSGLEDAFRAKFSGIF